jgi:hypothetical protein
MKRLRFFILISAALVFVASACAQKMTFPSLNNQDGVSKVFVNKTMLSMAGNSINLGGKVPGSMIKSLDSIEVLTAGESGGIEKIKKAMADFLVANPDLDVMVQVNDNGQDVSIYSVPKQGSDNIAKLIVYAVESGEAKLVVLSGDIDPTQISGLLNM